MFADRAGALVLAASLATCTIVPHGIAQTQKPDLTVTQARAPTDTPWSSPALFSYAADFEGDDSINIQVNAGLSWDITSAAANRRVRAGPYFIWNRNTQSKSLQNNLETGARFNVSDGVTCLDRPKGDYRTPGGCLDVTGSLDIGYARTAAYPDKESAVCVATPSLPQCATQFKESFRAVALMSPTHTGYEDVFHIGGKKVAYAITPAVGIAYDLLLDSKVDTKTGLRTTGGYLSGSAGGSIVLGSDFAEPGIEVSVTGLIRRRLAVSDRRKAGVAKTAGLFSASLTWFFIRPEMVGDSRKKGIHAGVGLNYAHGGDPLIGESEHTLLASIKIGNF